MSALPTPSTPSAAAAGLTLRGLACVRGTRTLFEGLDAEVPPGHLLRVAGANGAGKTSLLRMICGLLSPARGAVLWRGQPLGADRAAWGRELLYVGHAAALKDDLSAIENLVVAAANNGRALTERDAAAALAAAGLAGRQRLPARVLSQGQRRRVALARLVLGACAPLWVLDEPFNTLDAAATQWLAQLIEAQVRRGGTVVLTSHQSVSFDAALPQREVLL